MNGAAKESEPDILVVEDSPGDVMLIREAMDTLGIRSRLHIVSDGVEALRFLGREDEYADRPRPDLIFLDLNLPLMSGRETLERIKGHPDWKKIPVMILSTSDASEDIESSYELSANCYIVKPMDMENFRKVVRAINDFWLSVVRFPPKG